MGQIFPIDSNAFLGTSPLPCNAHPKIIMKPLKLCPAIKVPYYEIVYKHAPSNSNRMELVYKFFPRRFVSVILTKKEDIYDNEGIYFAAAGEYVYGYKNKNAEKIKKDLVLYKKRLKGSQPDMIDCLAELKLLCLLEVGPYIGRMSDNSDAYLTNNYLQYFGEVTLDIKPTPQNVSQKIIEKLKASKFEVEAHKVTQVSFSPHQKCHLAKLNKFQSTVIPSEETETVFKNNSSTFLRKEYEEESLKTMKSLDKKTRMLSAIENYLIQKNIEKAVDLFEENVSTIDSKNEKLIYVDRFCCLLSDSSYFKDYEEQVLTEAITTSCIIFHSANNSDYSRKLEDRLNKLRIGSTNFGSENQLEQFSNTFSIMDENSMKIEQIKININGNNKLRVRDIIKEIRGSNSKIQNDYQVYYEYAQLLMKSGKSRHALMIFQTLSRADEVPMRLKCEIFNQMGLIYYHQGHFANAARSFQNGLTKLIKLQCYSPAMMQLYNNIGCTFFHEMDIERSIDYFTRSLSFGVISSDHEMMARSNKAVAYMQNKMFKEARNQFVLIIKMVEPVNNASIICKAYTNLGYMNLMQNQFVQAMSDLQIANKLQAVCLIPNGHRPSLYLHNNIGMVHYKKRQFRKALAHFQKCKDQLETLKGMEALMINFNFAMIYKELYFHEFSLKHLAECKKLLLKMPQQKRTQFQKRIEAEINKLNEIRIVEDSEESSYARQSFSSKYSHKHL